MEYLGKTITEILKLQISLDEFEEFATSLQIKKYL